MDDAVFSPMPGNDDLDPLWGERDAFPTESYRPLGALTAWVVGLIAGVCILDILDVGLSAIGLIFLDRLASEPSQVAAGSFNVLDVVEMVFSGLGLAVYLATGIVFLVWFRRAYRNLLALDASSAMQYGPGWAVGAWFVPFLNLIRPKRIMDDIWRGTDPAPHVRTATPREAKSPALILAWWIAWLVSLWAGRAAFRAFMSAETIPELTSAYRLSIGVSLADIAVGILAIAVVLRVSQRQRTRAMVLASEEALPAVFRHPSYV